MSPTAEQPVQGQQERIVTLHESGSTIHDIALLEGLTVYRVRKALATYHESRERHEEWRDYGEGVSVRWFGQLRLAVLESDSRFRFYIRCEEKRIFNSSNYCYRSRREAMQAAESQARCYAR